MVEGTYFEGRCRVLPLCDRLGVRLAPIGYFRVVQFLVQRLAARIVKIIVSTRNLK